MLRLSLKIADLIYDVRYRVFVRGCVYGVYVEVVEVMWCGARS
jgi:hypothetical protein